MKDVYLYAAKRTPVGSFMGSLAPVSAPQLGAKVVSAILSESKLEPKSIDECVVGNVLTAGEGQAPARQVAVFGGLPKSVRAMTINKVCGSGLKAVTLASDRIQLGHAKLVLAGGTENMSQAPYYLPKAREGLRMGHSQVVDGMIHDGLWDVYNDFHMGSAAEKCAAHYSFSREAQDEFATRSYQKALKAQETNQFGNEIVAVEIASKKETLRIEADEEPGRGKPDKFGKLRPAFDKNGTVTAANASSINDGAALLLVGEEGAAQGQKPLAKILGQAEYAHEPEWFTTAPVGAIKKLFATTGLSVGDIDVFEINEAFSVVAMAAQKELEIPDDKLNPRGGAVAMGHPIGASGARLLVTLVHTLTSGQKGVVSLCIGGGEAIAVAIEKI